VCVCVCVCVSQTDEAKEVLDELYIILKCNVCVHVCVFLPGKDRLNAVCTPVCVCVCVPADR